MWQMLQERLHEFGLELSQEKSRPIAFGKGVYRESERNGTKLSTFDFLGFTHYMGRGRREGSSRAISGFTLPSLWVCLKSHVQKICPHGSSRGGMGYSSRPLD